MIDPRPYHALAELLGYPREGYGAAWLNAIELLDETDSDLAKRLDAFVDETRTLDRDAIEELYTRAFDLNPAVTLDIGHHLWGDAYERGRFLAKMRERLEEAGICENGELPDHLTSVLRLVPCLTDEVRDWWVNQYALMALDAMKGPLESIESPYRHLLDVVRDYLRRHHPLSAAMSLMQLRPVSKDLTPDDIDPLDPLEAAGIHFTDNDAPAPVAIPPRMPEVFR
ncbi:MAG: nitrate reductase molybdenum cofactor assembly chaperone [Thermoanaerobaculia bacterium]